MKSRNDDGSVSTVWSKPGIRNAIAVSPEKAWDKSNNENDRSAVSLRYFSNKVTAPNPQEK